MVFPLAQASFRRIDGDPAIAEGPIPAQRAAASTTPTASGGSRSDRKTGFFDYFSVALGLTGANAEAFFPSLLGRFIDS